MSTEQETALWDLVRAVADAARGTGCYYDEGDLIVRYIARLEELALDGDCDRCELCKRVFSLDAMHYEGEEALWYCKPCWDSIPCVTDATPTTEPNETDLIASINKAVKDGGYTGYDGYVPHAWCGHHGYPHNGTATWRAGIYYVPGSPFGEHCGPTPRAALLALRDAVRSKVSEVKP